MTVSRETSADPSIPLDAEDFSRLFPVSRETLEKLDLYLALLVQWQPRVNLVGPATRTDPWRRHILDSAQLLPYLPKGPLLDMGSGAGFPGLVLAILRAAENPSPEPVHLVESDGRKANFLREVARQTGMDAVQIHNDRMEKLAPFPVAVITARAVAPLRKLLKLASSFMSPETEFLFLKGRKGEEELTEASKDWTMTTERIDSLSDTSGIIFHLKGVKPCPKAGKAPWSGRV